MKLYLNFDRTLQSTETEAYRAAIQRRGQREPLQHIVGSVSFCGLDLAVDRRVLVPRPETELLAEQAILWAKGRTGPTDVLDFGTGSGCLAIAIAVGCPDCRISAVDISADALEVARQNGTRHNVQARVQFLEGNGLNALPAGAHFDLVVANPPYIPSAEIESLDPEVRDFDPRLALDGGGDGLRFYRTFAGELGSRIRPGGVAMMEFGDGQGPALQELFSEPGWKVDELVRDYSGRERILIARRSV